MKKGIKSKIICLLMMIFMLIGSTTVVFAADDFKIVVDNRSFIVSDKEVTVGDSVTLQMAITDGSNVVNPITGSTTIPLKYAIIHFIKPVTNQQTDGFYMKYNSITKLYELTLNIDDTWHNGTYYIDYVYGQDYDGNADICYNNQFNNYDAIDMSGCYFTVSGSTADSTLPTVYPETLTTDKRQVVVGDKVKYTIKLTDDTGISSATLWLRKKDNYKSEYVNLKYNATQDVYEGTLTIDSSIEKGMWNVDYISVTDLNNNTKYFHASDTTAWTSSKFSLYNYGEYPIFTLGTNTLKVNKEKATSGDTVEVFLQTMDRFEIDKIKLYYKLGEETQVLDANYLVSVDKIETINGVECTYATYCAKLAFNDYGYNGEWVLEKIAVTNSKNHTSTIYNSQVSNKEGAIDLSAGNFETYGLIDDATAPTISKYNISKQTAYYRESVIARVYATDENSGIQSVVLNYTLPNGTTKDYELEYNDTCYMHKFDFNNQDLVGEYVLNSITVTDKAGNVTKITKNISYMNYTFDGYIHIVAPDKYLETSEIYTLKAIFPKNIVSGVTWKSSDISVAEINSKTGELTTKSKEGKFTVTATANDGSGYYAKIELIVANSTVLVNQWVNMRFTYGVDYSEVDWWVSDTSVLNAYGRGYSMINGTYWHEVSLGGIKTGEVLLKMLTTTGLELRHTTVYVYDKVTSITAVDSLVMNKNDEINVNAKATFYGGSKISPNLYYVSDNDEIATVDAYGNVKAVKGGRTNITVYSKYTDAKWVIPVTVQVYATEMALNFIEIELFEEHMTEQLEYTIYPEDATDKTVTYTSANPKIATVSSTGLVTAVRNGETTVTIKSNDGKVSRDIKVTVTGLKVDIEELKVNGLEENYEYTGNEIRPELTIINANMELIEDVDYTVTYTENINAGKVTLTITGKGIYFGTQTLTFNIVPKNLHNITLAEIVDVEYSGEAHTPVVVMTDGEYTLLANQDFTVEYKDNVNAGTMSIDVTGKGNYTGTKTIKVKINRVDMSKVTIENVTDKSYTMDNIWQDIIAKYNGRQLVQGVDYSASYSNNKEVGKAKVYIRGSGNYKGEQIIDFEILPKNVAELEVEEIPDQKYEGKTIEPTVKINHLEGIWLHTLVEGEDYTYEIINNDKVGTATIIITGKGTNYQGTKIVTFNIVNPPISELDISYNNKQDYTGKEVKPKVEIICRGYTLVEGTDYILEYKNNIEPGNATMTITGIGDYSGTKEVNFGIYCDLKYVNFDIIAKIDATFNSDGSGGMGLNIEEKATFNGKELKYWIDYQEWGSQVDWPTVVGNTRIPGKNASVTYKGLGYFTGTKTIKFTPQIDISGAKVTGVQDVTYTGSAITQSINVKHGALTLKLNKDYTISYKNNVNAGVATLVIKGKGVFGFTKEINFNIKPRSVTGLTYSKIENLPYTGLINTPNLTVSYGKIKLVQGADYTLEYKDNIDRGAGTIVVKGKGNYAGTKEVSFKIGTGSIKLAKVEGLEVKYYTGSKVTQDLTLTYNGYILKEGVDYTLTYKNNVAVGIASVTITGKGNFILTNTLQFKIKGKDISGVDFTCTESLAYNGAARKATVVVKDGNSTLKLNKDYKIAYKNNVYPGTATVVVTGMGNYSGTKELTYQIIPRGITAVTVKGLAVKYYTGGARTQSLTLTYGGKTLKLNKDYTLTYENNVEVGIAKVIVKGIGNFQGETELLYKIKPRSVTELTFSKVTNKTYTGKAITPAVTIKHGSYTLVQDKDYTITYSKNVNVGTASITITGMGSYTGTKTIKFNINRRGISAATVEGLVVKYYTGSSIKQNLTLTYNGVTLKNGTDYTLTYKNNTKVGIASVTITGKGNYTSSVTLKYKIKAKDINELDFVHSESLAYNGSARNAAVTIKNGGVTLKLNKDYKVTYKNNVYPGTATMTITGIGSYTGTKTLTYNIIPRGITAVTIKGLVVKYYTGEEVKQTLKLTYGGKTLKEGVDYTLTYENNIEVGIASVKVTGIGNFQAETELLYKIKPVDVNNLSYNKVVTQSYTGNEIIPSMVVKNGTTELVEGKDYNITYSNNVKVGTAVITITGIGNYTGKKEIKFSIKKDEYYIKINVQANTVTIYQGPDSSNLKPVKAMVCSTGTATPKSGKYTIKSRWNWLSLVGNVYGQYCTQITGDILFHSVPYKKKSPDTLKYEEYDKLGTKASAGCIRLTVEDAKWIYDNIKKGVTVEFYNSSNPGPLGKPTAMKISANKECRNWDPTDPNVNNPWHKEIVE